MLQCPTFRLPFHTSYAPSYGSGRRDTRTDCLPSRVTTMAANDCLLCGDYHRDEEASGIARFCGRDILSRAMLYQTTDYFLIPAPGSFTPGYLILAPTRHLLNFAQLDHFLLLEAHRLISGVRQVARRRGLQTIVAFEHGGWGVHRQGAGCVEHAHLHLVPSPNPLGLRQALKSHYPERVARDVAGLAEIVADLPYVFLDIGPTAFVYETPMIPSQYVRQLLAAQWGLPEQWDWRRYPFPKVVRQTIELFGTLEVELT